MLELDGGADSGVVVYASSFSKTVCPGIRVGYLVGPPAIIDRHPPRGPPTPTSRRTWWRRAIVNQFCAAPGYAAALDTVRTALGERVETARRRAARATCRRRPFSRPEGGYFLWVDAARGRGARRRPDHAPRPRSAASPSCRAATSCSRAARTRSGWPTRGVPVEQIDDGVRRLAEAIEAARGPGSAAVAQRRRDAVDGQLDVAADQLVVVAVVPVRRRRSISTCRWCSGSR